MKPLAIIPTFNEGKNVITLIDELKNYIKDILVVDDGSTDDTLKKLKRIDNISILRNKKNQGKGKAIRNGFKYALKNNFDLVILLDSDLQHNPAEIQKFIEKSRHYDLVVGNRMHDSNNMPILRYFINKLDSFIISKITKFTVADVHCGYRSIKTSLIEKIGFQTERFEIEAEMVIKAVQQKAKISNLNIECLYSDEKSSINPVVDTYRFLKLIIKSI